MYAQLDTSVGTTGNAEVLDAIAQRFGVVHVSGGQLGDAFGVGLVELQRDTKGDGSQDGQLVCSIDAFNVEGRISFGITQRLRLSQHVVKGATLLAHFAEDKVASTVDDAGQPVDTVGCQAFANGLDHRDTARNSGFKGDNHALFTRFGKNFIAVHSDQRLVGGNHVLAVFDGFEHQVLGQGVTADQLDNDIDLRVVHQLKHIVGDANTGRVVLRLGRANGNLGNFNTAPCAPGNFLGISLEYIQRTATDGTQPTDAYFHRFHTELPICTA